MISTTYCHLMVINGVMNSNWWFQIIANQPDSLQKMKLLAGERRYSRWYQKTS